MKTKPVVNVIKWNIVVADEEKPLKSSWLIGIDKDTDETVLSKPICNFERTETLQCAEDKSGVFYLLFDQPTSLTGELHKLFLHMQSIHKSRLYMRYSVLPVEDLVGKA